MAFLRSILLLSAAAFIYGANASDPRLNAFNVHFDIKPTQIYQPMPRVRSQAILDGWKLLSSDCQNGGKYNGFRYIYGDDSSIAILFDINGNAVGLQMNIDKKSVSVPGNNYKYDSVAVYNIDQINGADVYTITAYFVDPKIICTVGRTDASVATDGVAVGVYLQNGPNPNVVIEIPYNRADAIAQGWTKNNCFVGMGYHNFYQSGNYGDCTKFRPAFGLYGHDDQIIGFGLASLGKALNPNNRYENPDSKAIKLIVGSVDDGRLTQCLPDLADSIGITTLHVYLTSWNRAFTCL